MELFLAFSFGVIVCLLISFFLLKILTKKQEQNFKLIANDVLNKNSEQFNNLFLNPFHQRIVEYKDFINSTHFKDSKDREVLREKISHLMDSAKKIETETNQLTKALTSDVKFQGDWGELTLEKILELTGLEKGREYETQNTLKHDDQTFRPDVIINLPNKAHIIIDSKVSLKSYFDYLDEKENALKELKNSVKTHIDSLSKKNYQLLEGVNSPEFVYLFIPVEGVYSLMLKEFPEIIDESLKKNIILVSPVNLIANLKTVAALWRVDKQSKSAVEIATKAGAMYDKFALLIDEMEKLGSSINRNQKIYEDIQKKLHTGKGNLMDRALELKEHGAKTSKEISQTH